jgi:hypothetical protein
MCRAIVCQACLKTTWAGCGLHIAAALEGVDLIDRCGGWEKGKCAELTPPAKTAQEQHKNNNDETP